MISKSRNLYILYILFVTSTFCFSQEPFNINDYILSDEYRLSYFKWKDNPLELKEITIRDTTFLTTFDQNQSWLFIQKDYKKEWLFITEDQYQESLHSDYHVLKNLSEEENKCFSNLIGRYTEAYKIDDTFYIGLPDYFCDNKYITITDSTWMYKVGCEGWSVKQITGINKVSSNEVDIELINTSFTFNEVDKENGIYLVESSIYKKEKFYMIHEKNTYRYNKIRCYSQGRPCSNDLKNYIRKMNLIEILEKGKK